MEYSVRGKKFIGVVISAKAPKTVTVEVNRYVKIPKYERYEKRKTRIYAHNELNAREGDVVLVGETRKISKTKSFVVLKIIGQKKDFEIEQFEKMEMEQNKEDKEDEEE